MSVCCSSALEEPAVSVEPVAVPKPSKASPKPLCVGAELLQGSGQLRQRGSCGHWCCEPGKRVCIMIHLWLGLLPRKMSVWGICHLFGLEYQVLSLPVQTAEVAVVLQCNCSQQQRAQPNSQGSARGIALCYCHCAGLLKNKSFGRTSFSPA